MIRAIQNDPSKCVLLVGAGLSAIGVRKGGKGLPDWDTLMRDMIDDLRESGRCDANLVSGLEKAFKKGLYLEVSAAYRKHSRPDQFAEFLREELDPPDIIGSRVHDVILRTGLRGVLTTNFDMVFECQSNRLQPLVYPHCLDDVGAFRKSGFFAKIHGCIRNTPNLAKNLVLTEESYVKLRIDSRYQTILRSLLVMNPLLTVGFSLRDPDFLAVMNDLREVFGDAMPTVYAIMHDPGQKTKDEWRTKGVEILPYQDHSEILRFFEALQHLKEPKASLKKAPPSYKESKVDYVVLAEKWKKSQKVEEMYQIISRQLDGLPNEEECETFLCRLLGLVEVDDRILLSPHLLRVGTPHCEAVLLSIFKDAERLGRWFGPKPHHLHADLHKWMLQHWRDFADRDWQSYDKRESCFNWLLAKDWSEHGVDLSVTFRTLLRIILRRDKKYGLIDLYRACDDIEGARGEIEKVVFALDFVPARRSTERTQSEEYCVMDDIRHDKFMRGVYSDDVDGLIQKLGEAATIEGERPDDWWAHYTGDVTERLLETYLHVSFMTVHGSSGSYDPKRAQAILDALASVKGKQRQLTILRIMDRREWEGPHRSPEHGWEARKLRVEVFVPLWWRYSTETRLDYLEYGSREGRMGGQKPNAGQNLLLHDFMGLTHDIDKAFREAFNDALDQYRVRDGSCDGDRYEPRQLQELWRGRELTYKISDETPPELVRRVAMRRVDWDHSEAAGQRWKEARLRADRIFKEGSLAELVSSEQKNYVIDNLLGSYSPEEVEIVLYNRMIELAAKDLRVDQGALSTIVYIHETTRAFSHVGRDRDGRQWVDFALPTAEQPDYEPGRLHEAIAQYYTFKLLQTLNDEKLMQTFLILEQCCIEIYRAWRATEHYTLEEMRNILVKCRKKGAEWPPSF